MRTRSFVTLKEQPQSTGAPCGVFSVLAAEIQGQQNKTLVGEAGFVLVGGYFLLIYLFLPDIKPKSCRARF